MSTKTTFKRVALVAVAALGFGVLSSVAPAGAADTTASTFTSSLSFNTTSITSVGALTAASGGTTEQKNAAVFRITANGNGGASAILKDGESITAFVSAVPTNINSTYTMGANKADLQLQFLSGTGYGATFSATGTANSGGGSALVDKDSTASVDQARLIGGGATASTNGVYFLGVAPADNKTAAMDAGFYTITVRLQDASGFITSYTVKAQFVTSPADSGAVIVPTITGTVFAGDSITFTTTKNMKATLRDANGGLIQGAGTVEWNPVIPTLAADIIDLTTGVAKGGTNVATIADSGVAAVDHVAITTDGTVSTASTREAANVINNKGDGTYGITTTALTAAAADGDSLRVRYGASSASAALTITAAATASTVATDSILAAGQVNSGNDATVPLTTKSVTFRNSIAISTTQQTGYAVYYTLAYGSACIAGDMSPAASTTPVKVLTDATGVASLTVTNASPLNSCTATVTWTGAATNPASTAIVTFAKAAAAKASASAGDYQAVLKSAQSVSWTITDQFGNAVANALVAISHTGANAPTVAPAQLTTDAAGKVTYTFTDAKGVAADATLGSDTVSVATVAGAAPSSSTGAVKITWKTALEVVASLDAYYADLTDMAAKVLVPTTAIGGSSGRAVSTLDQVDLTKTITPTVAVGHYVALQFRALDAADVAVTGVPTTITVTGGQLISSSGKLASTRTLYANEAFYVVGTKTGTTTVTATNGTFTKTATINFVNVHTDARVLKLTESNGLVTASVTDAFGNNVAAVEVDVVGSGGAWLGNGATSATFKTATDGTVTFAVTGSGTVSASLSRATYSKPSNLVDAGNSTGTVVTTGAPAGVRSASVTTTGYNVTSDAAQAANDAAAEATDAANAATDAANAAAEAADAATAAAQDAADAVAALSTQVSEMVNALKKQITALTNLVIKIQKKVKA